MKQKIVIKVSTNGHKYRSKSLQIAVGLRGVEHAGLGGADKDQIEVTGDGIDAVQLLHSLRKKVGFADLMTVGLVVYGGGKQRKTCKKKDKTS